MNNARAGILVVSVGLVFPALAVCTTLGGIESYSFPGGGGAASSASNTVSITLGQSLMGVGVSDSHAVQVGFQSTIRTSAPTGFLVPTDVHAGNEAEIVALLRDELGVFSAVVHYRVGGSPWGSTVAMNRVGIQGGQERWSARIPRESVTAKGVQYYVVASNRFHTLTLPRGAPEDSVAGILVDVDDLHAFSLVPMVYDLLGVPIVPEDDSPTAVFDELGSYESANWRYGTYDGAGYQEYPFANPARPGQGFWVISRTEATIAISGTSTALSEEYEIPLHQGWNQISNPFDFPVGFDDLRLPPQVATDLVGWDIDSTKYDHFEPILEPRRGYWLNCDASHAVLKIPPVGATASDSSISHGRHVFAHDADDVEWSVHARARVGHFADDGNRFGMRTGATAEKDQFDFWDAPHPPGGYVSLSLLHGENLQRFLTDYRGSSSSGESWDMLLESSQTGERFEVEFMLTGELPSGWLLTAIDTSSLEETDLTDYAVIAGQLPSPEFPHRWRIAAGPSTYVQHILEEVTLPHLRDFALDLTSENPLGDDDGTVIRMAVCQDAEVSLCVFNLSGQLVKCLHQGPLRRGIHHILWDACDERGRRAPAGVYFVRMVAPSFKEVRKVVLLK